jgi:type II restriction/modification system DNA methylase subunit YeeA
MPLEHVDKYVKPKRMTNPRPAYRQRWWLHAEARPGLRAALSELQQYIATPRIAKHRIFVLIPAQTVPDSQVVAVARDDYYFLGVLQSKVHELWALRKGTWLGVGNDPRYSQSFTFETYPFPWPPGAEPAGDPRVEAIVAAARRLVELRDSWLNPPGASEAELKKRTLTNLYNERPTWLANAHARLDAAALAAYGWPAELGDAEILARLLALNLERAAGQGAAPAARAEVPDEEG